MFCLKKKFHEIDYYNIHKVKTERVLVTQTGLLNNRYVVI